MKILNKVQVIVFKDIESERNILIELDTLTIYEASIA